MCIRTNLGDGVVVKPRQGGLQGDTCAAEGFAVLYDETCEEWIHEKSTSGGTIYARMPTDNVNVDRLVEVGTTLYADDIHDKKRCGKRK